MAARPNTTPSSTPTSALAAARGRPAAPAASPADVREVRWLDPRVTELELHPLAALTPPMNEPQYQAFRDEVRASPRGVITPVILIGGKLADGRHRWRACIDLGLECPAVEYDEGPESEALVFAANVTRKHLTSSQLAMMAAKWANRRPGRPGTVARATINQDELAARYGVCRQLISLACSLLDSGMTELIEQVWAGTMSLKAAKAELKESRASTAAESPAAARSGSTARSSTPTAATGDGRSDPDGDEDEPTPGPSDRRMARRNTTADTAVANGHSPAPPTRAGDDPGRPDGDWQHDQDEPAEVVPGQLALPDRVARCFRQSESLLAPDAEEPLDTQQLSGIAENLLALIGRALQVGEDLGVWELDREELFPNSEWDPEGDPVDTGSAPALLGAALGMYRFLADNAGVPDYPHPQAFLVALYARLGLPGSPVVAELAEADEDEVGDTPGHSEDVDGPEVDDSTWDEPDDAFA